MPDHNPYAALEKAVAAGDKAAALRAIAALSEHEKDLLAVCKRCGAAERVDCAGVEVGHVHVGRRLTRLIAGIR